ncbi:MAG TPA: anti-adapter protein IraP [Buttiauxella sp.]|nr:anti-adapter protein IraP [Buttiauxella sp.]HKM98348.1 anti-adapter protein IraP [Buttiauxella sp.]
MRNLTFELLTRLAKKEEESKELVAQTQALEIVVTAIFHRMERSEQQAIKSRVEDALSNVRPSDTITLHDTELLRQYLTKFLSSPCI